MNATTTLHSGTIQMKRSHLVGLVVGVAALTVALTTGAQAVLDSTDNRTSSAPSYVDGVAAMTPEELAATFGNVPVYLNTGLHRRRRSDDPRGAGRERGATSPSAPLVRTSSTP